VVFEGIHALNDMITETHPEAFKLYVSARSDVEFENAVVFKRTWFRLVRRTVRDFKFRGSDPAVTMAMWANVRRGEKLFISPFKDKADFQFDTSLPYEPAVFNATATKLFQTVPEGIERYEELRAVLPAIQLFGHIDEDDVAPDSLIREFIGGGIYGS
jgi:uridine kinase